MIDYREVPPYLPGVTPAHVRMLPSLAATLNRDVRHYLGQLTAHAETGEVVGLVVYAELVGGGHVSCFTETLSAVRRVAGLELVKQDWLRTLGT